MGAIFKISTADYNGLLGYAKGACKKYPHVEAEDAVNIVLLKWVEMDRPFNAPELRKKISGQISIEAHQQKHQTYFSKNERTRVCAKCGESLPIAAFSLVRRGKYNHEEVLYYCKVCQRKYSSERYYKKKHTIPFKLTASRNAKKYRDKVKGKLSFKLSRKAYMKKWYDKNKEKWNAYLRERYDAKK